MKDSQVYPTLSNGYLEVYREVTKAVPVRANLVPDAHLASVLRQHGVPTLYTNNVNEFQKFNFLDIRNPLRNPPEAFGIVP